MGGTGGRRGEAGRYNKGRHGGVAQTLCYVVWRSSNLQHKPHQLPLSAHAACQLRPFILWPTSSNPVGSMEYVNKKLCGQGSFAYIRYQSTQNTVLHIAHGPFSALRPTYSQRTRSGRRGKRRGFPSEKGVIVLRCAAGEDSRHAHMP